MRRPPNMKGALATRGPPDGPVEAAIHAAWQLGLKFIVYNTLPATGEEQNFNHGTPANLSRIGGHMHLQLSEAQVLGQWGITLSGSASTSMKQGVAHVHS